MKSMFFFLLCVLLFIKYVLCAAQSDTGFTTQPEFELEGRDRSVLSPYVRKLLLWVRGCN